jgi:hypothetical protein
LGWQNLPIHCLFRLALKWKQQFLIQQDIPEKMLKMNVIEFKNKDEVILFKKMKNEN